MHLKHLRKVWVDRLLDPVAWRNNKEDLDRSILPATVILSAYVEFLAIQTVDTGSMPRLYCASAISQPARS
ncbi:hypothetical protein C8Q80DRAFT_224097 [Daedaleopsis nitida]|nr:hypothetical protein C8Q80DRAFT_224097 [Daedaleopsis nitida]